MVPSSTRGGQMKAFEELVSRRVAGGGALEIGVTRLAASLMMLSRWTMAS